MFIIYSFLLNVYEIKRFPIYIFVVRCAILYHLYNFKNVRNTHGGLLLLVKLKAYSLQPY